MYDAKNSIVGYNGVTGAVNGLPGYQGTGDGYAVPIGTPAPAYTPKPNTQPLTNGTNQAENIPGTGYTVAPTVNTGGTVGTGQTQIALKDAGAPNSLLQIAAAQNWNFTPAQIASLKYYGPYTPIGPNGPTVGTSYTGSGGYNYGGGGSTSLPQQVNIGEPAAAVPYTPTSVFPNNTSTGNVQNYSWPNSSSSQSAASPTTDLSGMLANSDLTAAAKAAGNWQSGTSGQVEDPGLWDLAPSSFGRYSPTADTYPAPTSVPAQSSGTQSGIYDYTYGFGGTPMDPTSQVPTLQQALQEAATNLSGYLGGSTGE